MIPIQSGIKVFTEDAGRPETLYVLLVTWIFTSATVSASVLNLSNFTWKTGVAATLSWGFLSFIFISVARNQLRILAAERPLQHIPRFEIFDEKINIRCIGESAVRSIEYTSISEIKFRESTFKVTTFTDLNLTMNDGEILPILLKNMDMEYSDLIKELRSRAPLVPFISNIDD